MAILRRLSHAFIFMRREGDFPSDNSTMEVSSFALTFSRFFARLFFAMKNALNTKGEGIIIINTEWRRKTWNAWWSKKKVKRIPGRGLHNDGWGGSESWCGLKLIAFNSPKRQKLLIAFISILQHVLVMLKIHLAQAVPVNWRLRRMMPAKSRSQQKRAIKSPPERSTSSVARHQQMDGTKEEETKKNSSAF